jgi:hypothetical protein
MRPKLVWLPLVPATPPCARKVIPTRRSGQVPFHLRQKLGEVESGGTGSPGRFQVSAGPVAGLGESSA